MRQLKISKQITNRSSGTLDKYLSDIAKETLLTADEEVELAQRIKAGDQVALDKLVPNYCKQLGLFQGLLKSEHPQPSIRN